MIKRLLAGLILLSLSGTSYAATYYVEAKGSVALNLADDGATAWSNAQNILTPCSAKTAMARAQADDIVYFRGGTYNIGDLPGDPSWTSILSPTNAGTSTSNIILFSAYPAETPIFASLANAGKVISHPMGIYTNYVRIDGLSFLGYQSDGETPGVPSLQIYNCTYGQIYNCNVNGGNLNDAYTDNRELIRIEDTTNAIVHGCTLYDITELNSDDDTAPIKLYHNISPLIENCEIYNTTGPGIYFKGWHTNATVRYNFLRSCTNGIIFTPATSAQYMQGTEIYHNIFSNMTNSAIQVIQPGARECDDMVVYNNTLYNTVRGIGVGPTRDGHEAIVYNNIVSNVTYNDFITTCVTGFRAHLAQVDHNQWDTDTFNIRFEYACTSPDQQTYTSLASWQGSGNLVALYDAGCGSSQNPGCGSLASDPNFVNGSGTFSQIADFEPQAAATLTGSRTSGQIGADVSLVGTGAAASAATPTLDGMVPAGLRINQ